MGQEFGNLDKAQRLCMISEVTTEMMQQPGMTQWLGVGVIWGNLHLNV